MKRKMTLLLATLLSLVLSASCALLDPPPFEEGVLVDSVYSNQKANLQILLPEGWVGMAKKEAQQVLHDQVEQQGGDAGAAEDIKVDFTAYNPDTAATLAVSYEPLLRSQDLDSFAVKSVEANIADSNTFGNSTTLTDSFIQTIASRDCKVVVLAMSAGDITIEEYICYYQIDSYVCSIIIVPGTTGVDSETFDDIVGYFSAVN